MIILIKTFDFFNHMVQHKTESVNAISLSVHPSKCIRMAGSRLRVGDSRTGRQNGVRLAAAERIGVTLT